MSRLLSDKMNELPQLRYNHYQPRSQLNHYTFTAQHEGIREALQAAAAGRGASTRRLLLSWGLWEEETVSLSRLRAARCPWAQATHGKQAGAAPSLQARTRRAPAGLGRVPLWPVPGSVPLLLPRLVWGQAGVPSGAEA